MLNIRGEPWCYSTSMPMAPRPRIRLLKHKHRDISTERIHVAIELWSQRGLQISVTNISPGATKDIKPYRPNWLSLDRAR